MSGSAVAKVAGLAGLVLAAGSGRRMGRPKALVADADDVPWVVRAAQYLRAAGADPVVVALGAAADQAAALVPAWSRHIVVESWAEGVGATLHESLDALATLPPEVTALLLTLVDLPSARVAAAGRVIGPRWAETDLRRATYDGKPGHPVLIGRAHWQALAEQLAGDTGANRYLNAHGVVGVDCTDLGGGEDVDVQG
ncbi:nucleotidyltransferase family protein [Georgenia yuyongxinii]